MMKRINMRAKNINKVFGRVVGVLLFYLFTFLPLSAQRISSPDGKYTIAVDGMCYTLTYNNKVVVEKSRLGVDIDNRLFESALAVPRGIHENWSSDLVLKGEERSAVDTTWTPLYGEKARIRDHYNQLTLHYEKGSDGQGTVSEGYDKRKYYAMDIVVRAYNEGIAFRYHFPETANSLFLHIIGEQTQFAMPEGTMAWYEEWAQGPYEKRSLKRPTPDLSLNGGEWFESERPLLLQLPDGTYIALLEAAMKDYTRGKFKLAKDNVLQVAMYDCADIISPYDTPWRVIMAGERAVDLINHKDLVLNLNAERAEGDWSWVKPGKYIIQARRSGQDWFFGCMTNTQGRTVTVPTDFLPKGEYSVTIYNDDPTLNTRTNVSTSTKTIKAGAPLQLKLQPSGGAALHFKALQ